MTAIGYRLSAPGIAQSALIDAAPWRLLRLRSMDGGLEVGTGAKDVHSIGDDKSEL